ncbi:MAG TPA: hypothetical protein DEA08_18995 [Planctomycetes bacterium]|nr:hypothetical protein [Planctomycetota bacterium]
MTPWSLTARWPRLSLLLAALLTLILGLAARGVQPRYEIEDFFPEGTPARATYERAQEAFGRDDRAGVLVLESKAPLGPLDFGRIRASAARIASRSEVERVVSPATAVVPRKNAEGDVVLEQALPPGEEPSAARVAELLELYAQPPYAGSLVSRDGQVGVLYAQLREDRLGFADRAALRDALEAERKLLREHYQVHVVGYPIQRVELVEISQGETRKLLPLVLGAILLVGALVFRSAAGALLPLAVAGLSVLGVTGLMRLVGLAPNILSPAVYLIVAVVGVADVVHLLTRVRELGGGEEAVERALREVGPPCALASLTTALAFGGLALTGLPLVATMGLQVALGVGLAFALSLLLLPAAVRWGGRASGEQRGQLAERCRGLDAWAAPRGKLLVAGFLLLLVLGGGLATRLRVNAPLLADLDAEHPIRQAHRLIEARLGGVIPLELLVPPPAKGYPFALERMTRVEELTRRLREVEGVLTASSPVDALRRLQPFLAEVPAERVPGLVPTALLLAEDQVRPWVSAPSEGLMRIRLRIKDLDSDAAFALFARIEALYEEVLGEPAQGRLTGQGFLAQTINRDIVVHFRGGFLFALGAVALVLFFAFSDLWLVAVALLTNLFPVVLLAGAMAALGVELRYTSALVLSVVFGLAVDDTIHFVAQYRRIRAEGTPEALRETLAVAGPGLVLTSLLLALGFGALLLASFHPLRVMGGTLALCAALALAADLLLLPALLRLRGGEAAASSSNEGSTG